MSAEMNTADRAFMATLPAKSQNEERDLAARDTFERMLYAWRKAELGLGPNASSQAQMQWESREAEDQRLQMARDVIHAPVPDLCCVSAKLDVLRSYAVIRGRDMTPYERFLLDGICALYADLIHFGG